MAIITISRGSYCKGKDVAEKVAEKLGYKCIAREVFLDASKEFNIPEIKLKRAIHDAPSILDKFTHGKQNYVAYFKAELLKQFRQDNVVYHGLAGHFFVAGVSHALKVRIIADIDDRIETEMERENIPRDEALRILKGDDEERKKWSLNLYGLNTTDPSLYDLTIHIDNITVDDATDIICQTVALKQFRTTNHSQRTLEDLVIGAEVKAALIPWLSSVVDVKVSHGQVTVATSLPAEEEREMVDQMKRLTMGVAGVKEVEIKVLYKWSDERFFP